MPPNSSGSPHLLLKPSMRRAGPPAAGTSTPLAVQRSEFEDFMNAYRPTLDLPPRDPPPPRSAEESKVDFGRSIKKLMKRPQGSPNTQNKSHRKEGIQRTPTVVVGYLDIETQFARDSNPQAAQLKAKRPLSANLDSSLSPPQSSFGQGPTVLLPLDANLSKSNAIPQQQPVPPVRSPKTSVQQAPASSQPKASKPVPPPIPPVKSPKTSVVQHPPASPQPKPPPKQQPKQPRPEPEEVPRSASVLSVSAPSPNPNQQPKKKTSIQEEKRRSGTEGSSDAHCLIISGSNIGRFLPPRHNPDPILNMRLVPVQERKYHVILEFEESPPSPRPLTSPSGLIVSEPEVTRDPREQLQYFSWVREAHIAPMGMLLMNVERLTEFPFLTYLVVGGGRQELVQKLRQMGDRPTRRNQLRFLAGYEEPVTICKPPVSTFPEKPSSDKTGFVICLYQVLEGDDGVRFEQNWVMWTGARQLYRTLPGYMGLRRISVHKSIVPSKTVNYVLMCEFTNIMDHLTDACVIIDHLRARCCGFIGIFKVLDAL